MTTSHAQVFLTTVSMVVLGFAPLQAFADTNTTAANVDAFPTEQIERSVREAIDRQLSAAVEKEVTKQEDIRFRQFWWLVTIVGLMGLGTFGTLAKYVIEKTVEASLERRTNNITQSLAFSRFYTMALKLDVSDSFSKPDVDAIMNYLRKVETKSEIRHSPEFLASLQQVAKSFTSAGQSASIDELFQVYKKEFLSAPHLVQPLLHHYGQEIVGRVTTPRTDFGLATFEKLERVASSSHVPGLALAYRTLYESKLGQREQSGRIANLIRQSTRLDAPDRGRYLLEILVRSRETNWVRRPTPESTEIERVVRSLFSKHAQVFENVYGLVPVDAQQIATQGVDKDHARQLADQMAAHV